MARWHSVDCVFDNVYMGPVQKRRHHIAAVHIRQYSRSAYASLTAICTLSCRQLEQAMARGIDAGVRWIWWPIRSLTEYEGGCQLQSGSRRLYTSLLVYGAKIALTGK
jgi:hypothetical protein